MNPLESLYEVIDILKDGKNGKVNLVYDKTGKQVCILKERNLKTAELYRRLKEIKNPYLPEIFRAVELGGKFFVVEEFIEGQTLAEILIYKNCVTEKIAAQILKQICAGLKILHENKIIHRDIKPSNIILTKNNSVKLIDFSISRFAKNNSESDTDFLGTRGYAPPEQFGFGQTDARSDIFSLGVTMKKMLGENYKGYLKKILSKCTELDPANRYQNVAELSADIDKKFYQTKFKKFLAEIILAVGIIFFVIFLPKNFFEIHELEDKNFDADKNSDAEQKISEPEQKKIPTEKNSELKQEKNFQFPEIKIPDAEKNSDTEKIFEPEKKYLPVEVENKNLPSDPRLKKICTVFLNGKIFRAEDRIISESVWKSWKHEGDIIFLPQDWNLDLKIENKNSAPENVTVKIFFNGLKKSEKNLFAGILNSDQTKNFSIQLGGQKFANDTFEAEIFVSGSDDLGFSWQGGKFGKIFTVKFFLQNYDA